MAISTKNQSLTQPAQFRRIDPRVPHPSGRQTITGADHGAGRVIGEGFVPANLQNARILGFNYDTGERYLSVPDFLPEA
jgi:hypothetical protein